MSSITIRRLAAETKQRLRIRAAEHGRSMEDEAREILQTTLVAETAAPENLAESIRRRFGAVGGVNLQLPAREPMREPPDFTS
jgi:plasmid stability protein